MFANVLYCITFMQFLLYSYGVPCFLLKTVIIRRPQFTTQSPFSDDISCFLMKIAIVRGLNLLMAYFVFFQIALRSKYPPPMVKIPSPQVIITHRCTYGQNGISSFLLKVAIGMFKIPPTYGENTPSLPIHVSGYPLNEHVPC